MDDGRILLHYYSDRKGLYHIVPGESFKESGTQNTSDTFYIYLKKNPTFYILFVYLFIVYLFCCPYFNWLIRLCCSLLTHRSGIIEAVAKDFFDSEVTMTILNQSEEDERTGKKEHVVFHMVQKEKVTKRKAQTRQNNSDEEIQEVKEV